MSGVLRTTLIAKVREEGDLENDTVITDVTIGGYLDDSCAEAYEELIDSRGADYYVKGVVLGPIPAPSNPSTPETSFDFPIASGLSECDLYRLESVMYLRGGTVAGIEDVRKAPTGSRPWLTRLTGDGPYYYALRGNQAVDATTKPVPQIEIWPRPVTGALFRLDYIPTLVRRDPATGDLYYDAISGVEMFSVYDAIARCYEKQQMDSSPWVSRRETQRARIRKMAPKRDAKEPEYQKDARGGDHRQLWPKWQFNQG